MITDTAAANSSSESTARSPAAEARPAVAVLRPSRHHTTSCPAATRTPPTPAPIAPGCNMPTAAPTTDGNAIDQSGVGDPRDRRCPRNHRHLLRHRLPVGPPGRPPVVGGPGQGGLTERLAFDHRPFPLELANNR